MRAIDAKKNARITITARPSGKIFEFGVKILQKVIAGSIFSGQLIWQWFSSSNFLLVRIRTYVFANQIFSRVFHMCWILVGYFFGSVVLLVPRFSHSCLDFWLAQPSRAAGFSSFKLPAAVKIATKFQESKQPEERRGQKNRRKEPQKRLDKF